MEIYKMQMKESKAVNKFRVFSILHLSPEYSRNLGVFSTYISHTAPIQSPRAD